MARLGAGETRRLQCRQETAGGLPVGEDAWNIRRDDKRFRLRVLGLVVSGLVESAH
jgi:hypothetical protein